MFKPLPLPTDGSALPTSVIGACLAFASQRRAQVAGLQVVPRLRSSGGETRQVLTHAALPAPVWR